MIRLQTLGGAVLFTSDGLPLAGAASQRRTLALLSVLAAAGEAGLTRDKLVGILWPEKSASRARHSLTQALYAARRALDCDDLFEVSEDVRLNPARLRSDVGEFECAVRTGNDAAAVELYRGAFLDGFFLAAPEFERWLAAQRVRLEVLAVGALERLSEQAEAQGDCRAAISCLQRLAALRPSDTTVATRLMKSLAAAGDRGAAIQQGRTHARILREEFELEPDDEVLQLAHELRLPRAPMSSAEESAPDSAAESVGLEPAESDSEYITVAVPIESDSDSGHLPVHYEPRSYVGAGEEVVGMLPGRRIRRRLAALAPVLVLTVFAYLFGRLAARTPRIDPLNQRVVVAPFRVHGADASLEYLREGLVELLSTRLADDTAARSVDAGAVIRAWRRAGITSSTDAPRDTVVRLAARLGAERVIVGSVVGTPARAIVSAAVIGATSGQVSGEVTVEGPTDSLTSLVDRLAGKLLVSQASPDERLADRTTPSLPALRSYLAGLAPYAQGDYAVAADRYMRALRLDSTFVLAALRLALAAERLNDFELQRRMLDLAWRQREGLSERDRAHLMALVGPRYPAASTRSLMLAAWDSAGRLAANRAEVWYGFASAIVQSAEPVLHGNDLERATAALERTLELDANHAPAQLLLARIAGRPVTVPAAPSTADSSAARPAALQSLTPFLRWRAAALAGDSARLAPLVDSLAQFGPANLRALALASQFDAVRISDGARALRTQFARAANSDQAMDLLLAEHGLVVNQGRPAAALEATRRIQRLTPATRAHLRLRVLDVVFAEGDSAAAALAAAELERMLRTSPSAAADACALAQWQMARRDTVAVRRTLALLRRAPGYDPLPVSTPPAICADLLEATLAVAGERADARTRVARLDSLVLNTAAAGDAATYAHIVVARLQRALEQPQQALTTLRRRPYYSAAWPRYLATSWREEGNLALQLGDTTAARTAFHYYLALRSSTEPRMAAAADSVRAQLAELARTK